MPLYLSDKEDVQSDMYKILREAVLARDRICQHCFNAVATKVRRIRIGEGGCAIIWPSECVGLCAPCDVKIYEQELEQRLP